MQKTFVLTTFIGTILSGAAFAAPIGAFSEIELNHSFVVNGGSIPEGILIGPSFDLSIERDATSAVDDPTAVPSETNFVQVGNPFADPPLPFITQRTNASQLPGGFEGSASGYDVEITVNGDPDVDTSGFISRSIEQSGSASAILLDDTTSASATSLARGARSYIFTNVSDQLRSFNIVGQFDARLSAGYTGEDGIARAAGGFELDFVGINGASLTYFPVSPYLTTIINSDPGTSVTQSLLADDWGLEFNATASALGTGGATEALFEGEHRYVFGITLEPTANVILRTSYTQANSVEHIPLADVAPVPLPASAFLLILGVGSLVGLRRRRH